LETQVANPGWQLVSN